MEAIYVLSVLIIFVLPKTNGEYTCDEDWKLVGDACVGVFTKIEEKTNWHVARDKCKQLNSTLITIRSSIKQSLLAPIFSGDVWIDLTKDTSSNEFYWANGDPKADYQSWQTGQPNNGGEGCAVILGGYSRGYWADKACFNKYCYICESPSVTGGCLGKMIPLAGKCYNFSKETKNWNEAREACRENGGDLLVIENTLKNNLITEKIAEDSVNRYRTFWIGASDIREEGKWKWLDQNQVMTYQNWTDGSPDNGGNGIHSCVYMASTYRDNGAWKTQICEVAYPSCCEKRPAYENGNAACEDDWKLYNNDSCLFLNKDGSNWDDARRTCKRLGGDLVVVKDSTKSAFVRKRVVNLHRSRTAWIGMRDNSFDGTWNWLNSTEEATFSDWYTGYPMERLMKRMDCVFMRATSTSSGRWANSMCSVKAGYICEMVAVGQCAEGWLGFNGHCYKFNYDISDWDQSRARCKLQNAKADLAVIDNSLEQLWLQFEFDMTASIVGFWIGLNSKKQKDVFVWLNDTTQASYTNWDATLPSYIETEACVTATGTYRRGEWKDEGCLEDNGYICEKPAAGDASYYDFKYNSSVYKVLTLSFSPEHGDEFCKEVLGINSTLIYFENQQEMDYIYKELAARGKTGSQRFWTKGTTENTPNSMFTTPRPTFQSLDSLSRTCLELHFVGYKPQLRPKLCCEEEGIICEKHIDPKWLTDNKYDFALNASIYRMVDEEEEYHDIANTRCAGLLDNSGALAQFETWEELEAVSREILARHVGEHFIYWVGGDPLDDNRTSIDPIKSLSDGYAHCMVLEYDPKSLHTSFDSTMTLRSAECTGRKRFLCEQKGIHSKFDDIKGSMQNHLNKFISDPEYRSQFVLNSGCFGPCIGLAVALPFVTIGAVVITVGYFWFIRRQSPYPVKFNQADDEVRLTM